LAFAAITGPTGFDELVVRVRFLRILVEVLHVRIRRRAVEVEVVLLDVLAVVAFAVCEAEEAFLEDRVPAVPQSHRKAEGSPVAGDACKAILPPAVGTGAGLVMGEVVPGVAALAVILANGAPLPFAEVGPPLPPGNFLLPGLVEANVLSGHGNRPAVKG